MQTKKRAKAVKFGKKIVKETPPEQIEQKQEEQQAPQEEAKITEIQEVTIETSQEPPKESEPPKEPPAESQESSPKEPEETQESALKIETSDTYIVETKSKKNIGGYFMLIAIISFIIGLLSMAGINFLNQKELSSQNSKTAADKQVAVQASPTNNPSPTETPLDISQYNIQILNGSGIVGAAAKLKNSLTSEGFTVTTTGNAAMSSYAHTTISAKKDINPKYLTKLKSLLEEESYTLATDSGTTNEPTGVDIIITIGKE